MKNPDIGSLLKTQRTKHNLTLDKLSELSGVSKAMLSQIEKDKVNPTVAILIKIADAMNIDISELINTGSKKNIFRIIPSEDSHYTFRADDLCSIRTLSPLNLEKSIEFYCITLKPGGKLKSEAHYTGTEEFLSLEQGKITVISGQDTANLNKGDSIHYKGDIPHCLDNTSKKTAKIYLIVRYK